MIVAVTLGTDTCRDAVAEAAARAKEEGRPLRLVYVAHQGLLADKALDIRGPQDLDDHMRHVARIILARDGLVAKKAGGIVEDDIVVGRPAGSLSQYVKQHKADDLYVSSGALPLLRKWSKMDFETAISKAGAHLHVTD